MHLALVSGVRCVSIFTCTIRWETYEASGIVGDAQNNILSFILSAVEGFLLKSSSSRHANARA
jgi:hypothetical protein